jgi:hypothetical protein
MNTEAFEWFAILAAWFGIFGLGATALAAYEWYERRRNRDLLPKPGGRARVYRADPPSVSRWGSTR